MKQQYKTIPFSLEKARIEGNKVVTRDGFEVEDWYYFKSNRSEYPITYINKNGDKITTSISGIFNVVKDKQDLLILEPIKEEVMWGNVMLGNNPNKIKHIRLYETPDLATAMKGVSVDHQIKATFIDGLIVKTEKI